MNNKLPVLKSALKQASVAQSISIVIPVFNEQDHLKKCLDSIAKQTVKPLQVIVVDNNSTDKSVSIAKSYPFVTLLKEKRQGIAYARNKGFNAVKADIIGRIDADSVLTPGWDEYAINYLSKHPDELLTGGSDFYDLGMPRFSGWFKDQIAFRANRFIMGYYIAWGSNMVMPQKMWLEVKDKVHNDPSIHEDMDLSIHLHELGYKITYRTDFRISADSRITTRHPRSTHMKWLKMWPRTFRFHHLPRAWMGDVGVYFVYFSWYPILLGNTLGDKFGRKRKK